MIHEQSNDGLRREIIVADGGVSELAAWLATTPETRGSDTGKRNDGHEWDFNVGYAGAVRLLRDGWAEGAAKLQGGVKAQFPDNDRVHMWRYDVAGEMPDVGRFLGGEPEHMRRRGKRHTSIRVIGLAVSIGIRGMVTANQQENFGLAVLECIDAIEDAGTRVEVYAMSDAESSGRITYGWMVKRADEVVDLAALAFSVAHPAAHRRIGFAMRGRVSWPNSMGASICVTKESLPLVLKHLHCIGGLAENERACRTREEARRFVASQINEAAGETLVELED